MAPQRVRKLKSITSTASTPPVPVVLIPTKLASPSKTPTTSPRKRRMVLTQGQKQALIDNLQLEITERARKLRAQYALQAQGLRTRLEIRVHRIPAALRKMTIEELLEKHAQQSMVHKATKEHASLSLQKTGRSQRQGTKRKSDVFDMDKENESQHHGVENPKKRSRPGVTATISTATARNPSTKQTGVPSQILSPRSNNSRKLPPSSFKSGLPSPVKSNVSRPVSPLKPSIAAQTAKSLAKNTDKVKVSIAKANKAAPRAASKQGTTAAGATRGKREAVAMRPPPPPGRAETSDDMEQGRDSTVSDANSVETTIIKSRKVAQTVAMAKKAGLKKAVTAPAARGGRVAAAVSKVEAGGSVNGGRTLRKRA